jgi:hypothetical protein
VPVPEATRAKLRRRIGGIVVRKQVCVSLSLYRIDAD